MEQKNQNLIAAAKVILATCTTHGAILANSTPMNKYRSELETALTDAEVAMDGQTSTSTGITQDKYQLEADAVAKVVLIGNAAKSLAMDTDNHTLLVAVDWSRAALLHLPQQEASARLRDIIAAARLVAVELSHYDVQPAEFSEAEDAITKFAAAIPATRESIVEKGQFTDSVPHIMTRLRKIIAKMKAFVPRFETASPAFVAAFKRATIIVDAGTRHDVPPKA